MEERFVIFPLDAVRESIRRKELTQKELFHELRDMDAPTGGTIATVSKNIRGDCDPGHEGSKYYYRAWRNIMDRKSKKENDNHA